MLAVSIPLRPFLAQEIALLERRLAAARPTIGICLGAQLMARALGARVYPARAKEIGWGELQLSEIGRAGPLRHLVGVPVLHWHGDTFDLPDGAEHLASTEICPNQAFSFGSHGLACQFHPEISGDGFERWLVGHAVELAAAPDISPAALRRDTERLARISASRGEGVSRPMAHCIAALIIQQLSRYQGQHAPFCRTAPFGRPTAENAEAAALENCQINYGRPCALVAVDDALQLIPAESN